MDNEISLQQIYDKLVSFDTRLKNLENPPNRSSYAMNHRNYAQVVSDNCNATRTFYNKNPNLGITYKQFQPQNRMPNNNRIQSGNPQFTSLSKTLFQYVQIRRCTTMWHNLPKPIDKAADDLFSMIRLPMPDDQLNNKLQTAKNDLKSLLVTIAQEHALNNISETNKKLKNMDTTDKEVAKSVARTYLKKHFQRKLNQQETEQLLDEALEIVGQNLILNTAAPLNKKIQNEHVKDNPINGSSQRNKNKRGFEFIKSPITTMNRFNILSSEEEVEIEDLEAREEIQNNSSSKVKSPEKKKMNTSKSPKPKQNNNTTTNNLNSEPSQSTSHQNTESDCESPEPAEEPTVSTQETQPNINNTESDCEVININNSPTRDITRRFSLSQTSGCKPIIHDETNWKLKLKAHTKTIVIADSNFRYATELPKEWEIHVFPGLNIEQTTNLIKMSKLQQNKNLQNIIIHSGINNRRRTTTSNNIDVGKLNATLLQTKKNVLFNAVSIPSTLSTKEQDVLTELNDKASRCFQEKFIQPLTTNQVSVSPKDKFKIHYTKATINKICNNISSHFLRIHPLIPTKQ